MSTITKVNPVLEWILKLARYHPKKLFFITFLWAVILAILYYGTLSLLTFPRYTILSAQCENQPVKVVYPVWLIPGATEYSIRWEVPEDVDAKVVSDSMAIEQVAMDDSKHEFLFQTKLLQGFKQDINFEIILEGKEISCKIPLHIPSYPWARTIVYVFGGGALIGFVAFALQILRALLIVQKA